MDTTWLPYAGAFGFGAIIGWYVYYVNRYRRGEIQFSDITTLVGVIGGAGILKLFAPQELFGAYGLGLFVGFFGYLIVLAIMVRVSSNFSVDFFLDGRRKQLAPDETIPGEFQQPIRTMSVTSRLARLEAQIGNATAERAVPQTSFAEDAWTATPEAQKVIGACTDAWNDDTKADCNKYVKAVAAALGHSDFGDGEDANSIAADLADPTWRTNNGWTAVADGAAAKTAADSGLFVVGAIAGANYVPAQAHDHVVVVVSSADLHKGKYPYAYWGKLDSVGEQNQPVTHAYNAASVDKVVYASRSV